MEYADVRLILGKAHLIIQQDNGDREVVIRGLDDKERKVFKG